MLTVVMISFTLLLTVTLLAIKTLNIVNFVIMFDIAVSRILYTYDVFSFTIIFSLLVSRIICTLDVPIVANVMLSLVFPQVQ